MPERTVRKVEPRHSIEFIDPATILEPINPQVSTYSHAATVPYKDLESGGSRLIIIRSDDEMLVRDMSEAARRFRERAVTAEQISESLSLYATRLPIASIAYGEHGTHINCGEPSCRFYVGGGCTNENVVINDDCGDSQSCMTYELDTQNN